MARVLSGKGSVGVAMMAGRGVWGCGLCPGDGGGCGDCRVAPVAALPPFPPPASPHRVAPAHSCHQNPSLSPPHCGANEFSREPPQAQHAGRPHPRPRSPGPASEGPLAASESAQGVGEARPKRRRGCTVLAVTRSPGHRPGTKTHEGLAREERAGGLLPIRPEPGLALLGFSVSDSSGTNCSP